MRTVPCDPAFDGAGHGEDPQVVNVASTLHRVLVRAARYRGRTWLGSVRECVNPWTAVCVCVCVCVTAECECECGRVGVVVEWVCESRVLRCEPRV
jgi:hypothetical protein